MNIRPATFEAVFSSDPEIDLSKIPIKTMRDYLSERVSLDPIRHAFSLRGPTIYKIREIPRSLFGEVLEAPSDEEKYRRAFLLGVESVSGIYQSDGTRLESALQGSKTTAVVGGTIRTMTDDDLYTYFSPAEWLEIGSVAFTHGFFQRRIAHHRPRTHTIGEARLLDRGRPRAE